MVRLSAVLWLLCVLANLAIFAHHEWGERQATRKRHGMHLL